MASEKPAAPCASPLLYVWVQIMDGLAYKHSQKAEATSQKQNKLQGKEVVNINKDPIRRLNVKHST